MMPTVLRILSLALIPIVVQLIFSSVAENNGKELIKNLRAEHVVLHLPRIFTWIGVAGVLGFGGCLLIMIFFPNGSEAGWVYACFLILTLIPTYLVLYTLLWKLECFRNEDFFVYRPFLGKGRKIFYRDVEYYRFETGGIKIKTKTGKISIDRDLTNMEIFLAMLTKHGVPEKK